MSCLWKAGLLTMRLCDQPAAGGCAMCGMPLCSLHTVMGPQGPACPLCASRNDSYPETEDTEIAESREQYSQQYPGAVSFGEQGYFSGADRAALSMPFLPQSPRRGDDDYDVMES